MATAETVTEQQLKDALLNIQHECVILNDKNPGKDELKRALARILSIVWEIRDK